MLYPKLKFYGKVPKEDYSDEQCQDSYAILNDCGYAISDGATHAIYSEIWAEILVNSFETLNIFSKDVFFNFDAWINQCQKLWQNKEEELKRKNLPWFTLKKLNSGSYATFLGLRFKIPKDSIQKARWKCIAIGDSCLFVVKDDKLKYRFPIKDSKDFSSTPNLISTKNNDVVSKVNTRIGKLANGYQFYLMTDALAKWFLEKFQNNQQPWQELNKIENKPDFIKTIDSLRKQEGLVNDDVTLIVIECMDN